MPSIEQTPNYLPYSYPAQSVNYLNPSNYNGLNYNVTNYQLAANPIQIQTSPTLQTPNVMFQNVENEQRVNHNYHHQQYNNNNNKNKTDVYYPNMIRSKRSGHVSKNRVSSKRTTDQINLQKSCPNCSKYWRNCKCSNIKNRPDPKPYCKFVPPRMLKKQMSNSNEHEN